MHLFCFYFMHSFIPYLFFQVPQIEAEWKTIAHDFDVQWNFSHSFGTMDGKHIVIRPPPGSGSYYLTLNTASV